MKSLKKLSLLGLFAISMAQTSHVRAEALHMQDQEISVEFQQKINENFGNLLNGSASFDEAISALEDAAKQENNPILLEDIAFLKQNRKQIITCLGRIKQLYAKVENYLDQALKAQIKSLGLAQWIKILTK